MPTKNPRIPSYRLHKGSGQAFVQIKGRRYYLGKYGSDQSRERYRRIVAELCSVNRTMDAERDDVTVSVNGITIVELLRAYFEHLEDYYGNESKNIDDLRPVFRLLKRLYGRIPASELGPVRLKVLRKRLIQLGQCRPYVNRNVTRVKRMFRWAVSEELIHSSVSHALNAVEGLRRGHGNVREGKKISLVSISDVEAVLPHLSSIVQGMVGLQLTTGMRPGEVCILRPADVDRSDEVWLYRPSRHKTEIHDRTRIVAIGPRGQEILRPYLLRSAEQYCFSPREAVRNYRQARHEARKTPLSCGNRPGSKKRRCPAVQPGECYTTNTYRQAIYRACDRAGIPRWAPNRLRHTRGTEVRRLFGLEAAQVTLGHANAKVSERYAECDLSLARKVAKEVG